MLCEIGKYGISTSKCTHTHKKCKNLFQRVTKRATIWSKQISDTGVCEKNAHKEFHVLLNFSLIEKLTCHYL